MNKKEFQNIHTLYAKQENCKEHSRIITELRQTISELTAHIKLLKGE